MKYRNIMWAEMKPDLYAGKKCNEVAQQWYTECEGDMERELLTEPITFDPKTFFPGTKIIVSVPLCPECELDQECCDCGFDWDAWRDNEYS